MTAFRVASLVFCFGALAACDDPNPGTPLGTFDVASALATNTCGGEVAATDPGSFDVTLSNEGGIIWWFPNTGASAVSGGMNSNRTVTVSEVVADDVDETEAGSGPCVLQRNDTLSFTLAPGAQPGSFVGAYTFITTPANGANCSDQLTASGGVYGVLPCTVSYKLTGTRE